MYRLPALRLGVTKDFKILYINTLTFKSSVYNLTIFIQSSVYRLTILFCLSVYMLTFAFVLSVYKLTIMGKKSLQIQQLNSKMLVVASIKKITPPPTGWIKAVRTALGMSLQQLGNKISITKQSLTDIERREKDGSITLKTLRDAANALDMELVYGFVPKDGSLDALIDRKAIELATQIVLRTSNTMKLEDQGNSDKRIQKAIEERAASIKNEMPKILWD